MKKLKIAIIGVGHMGSALAQGLLNSRTVSTGSLILSNQHSDNKKAAKGADIIILAVRPKVVANVIREIKSVIKDSVIILSVAACVDFDLLERYFASGNVKIARLMPNISVLYNQGVVGWVGNKNIKSGDKNIIQSLLKPLGMVINCKDEMELDRVDILSGCGPGIVAYIMRNFEKAAEKYGFSHKVAQEMTRQVFSGSLKHLESTGTKSEDLIIQVATKGGITEEVLKSLDESRFYEMIVKSIEKGYRKVNKITEELKREFKTCCQTGQKDILIIYL